MTLRTLRVAADPLGVAQREVMSAPGAPPHVVINASDPLFSVLAVLEQCVVGGLVEAGHPHLTRGAAAAVQAAPLPEAEERA